MSASPTQVGFKPLSTGEVLDAGFRMFRKHFKPLYLIALVFQLVAFASEKTYELVGYAKFPSLMKVSFTQHGRPDVIGVQLAWAAGAAAVIIAVSMVIWQLGVAAVSSPPAESLWFTSIRPAAAISQVGANLGGLLGTLALELVLLALAAALGAVPGLMAVLVALKLANAFGYVLAAAGVAGGLLVSLGAFLAVMLRYLLVAPVVVVERISGWTALKRSAELMRAQRGLKFFDGPKIRASLLLLAIFLATNSLAFLFALPRVLMLYGFGEGHSLLSALFELVSVLGQAAVTPFGLVVMVVFYLDLRVRREGLDLDLAIDSLSSAA